ncbi:MAG: sensor domain-containing diguanylate cyclase [Candidatus Tenebribacter burtonii]|nr:sensor domain-containing diguanylate cyclase [Candidatus Tenebribacter burtonii]
MIIYILLKVFHIPNYIYSLYGNFEYKLIELLIIFFVSTIGLIVFTNKRFNENKKDLYEWVDLNNKLNQYESKFENIVYNVSGIAIYGIGKDHRVTYWNRACEKMFGFENSKAVGKKIEDLIVPNSILGNFKKDIDKYYESNIEIHHGEIDYLHENGTVLNVLTSFHKQENIFGIHELYNLSVDLTELKRIKKELRKSNAKLRTLARTDSLTHLPNRYSILEKINHEKLKYERSKEIFTIAMVDLDNFKEINDKYGHNCGDFVLKQFSNIMVNLVRKQDVVGRYGGDEFILLLPQTNASGALHLAKLILQKITKFPIKCKGIEISLTATIGVIDYQDEEITVDDLIKKADKAMYKGKAQGKNKAIVLK